MVFIYYEFAGPRGPQGPKGASGACIVVRGKFGRVTCPSGKVVFVCISRCARKKVNLKRACISTCRDDKVRALCCGK